MWVTAEEAPKPHFQVILKASFESNSSIYPFINYSLSSVHKAVQATWEWHLISAFLTSILDDPEAHNSVKTTASSCAYIRDDSCLSCLPFGLRELEETQKELLEGRPGKATFEADWRCITHALELVYFIKHRKYLRRLFLNTGLWNVPPTCWICMLAVGESYIFFKISEINSNACLWIIGIELAKSPFPFLLLQF